MFNLFKSKQRKLFESHIKEFKDLPDNLSNDKDIHELQISKHSLEQSRLYITLNPLRASLPSEVKIEDPYQLKRGPESEGLLFFTSAPILPETEPVPVLFTSFLKGIHDYALAQISSTKLNLFLKTAARIRVLEKFAKKTKPWELILETPISLEQLDIIHSISDTALPRVHLTSTALSDFALRKLAKHLNKDIILKATR